MKIVIDIPEDVVECAKSSPNYYPTYHFEKIWSAIVNGTPYEERPQGEWIMDKEHTINPLLWYKCNLCGVYHPPTNFCPCCGAKMKGGAE